MAVEISLSGAKLTEANDSMYFTVSLSAPAPSSGVTVAYRTIGGTAAENVDYDRTASTLTIAPGQISGQVRVVINADVVDETDEAFTLELSNPVGAVFAGDAPVLRAAGVILDNDGIGSNLSLIVSNPVVLEGNAGTRLAHVEATLSSAAATSITVPYQTANGTAVAGQDYTATSGSLTFLAGQTTASVDIPIIGDTVSEPTESFSLVFAPPAIVAGGAIGATGVVTILDDDAAQGALPSISVSNARLTEANDSMYFTVTLSAPAPSSGVTVVYRTIGGTALEDVDYDRTASTLTIAPGQTSAQIRVVIDADVADEPDDAFTLELSNPVGAVFAGDAPVLRATGIILDNDGIGSNLSLTVSNPVVLEGNAGTKLVHVEATLSSPSSAPITVPYQTVDGSAVAGQDYTATSGSLTFLAGQTTASVDVPIIGDTVSEPTESFSVVFAPPAVVAGGAIGATGIVTILDDDAARGTLPSLSISSARLNEANDSMYFTVTLSAPAPSSGVTVAYRTVAGTAAENTDYDRTASTLTIAPGQTSAQIRVVIDTDATDETDESFSLELTNPTGATFAGDAPVLRAAGIILDNDGIGSNLAVIPINPTVLEGDTGTQTMHFEVLLSQPVNTAVAIPYQTLNGTATAGQDFVPINGTITFAPGQTLASVDVPIIGDYTQEDTETFSVLFGASSAGPATAAITATGTIVNNDTRVAVNGTTGDDKFTDSPANELFIGGTGRDVLTVGEVRRGDLFILDPSGDVNVVHGTQADTIRGVEEVRFIDGRMVFDAADPAASVVRLYQAALGHLPDQDGLNFWIANLQRGISLSNLAAGFLSSPEFTNRFGTGLSNNDFTIRIYQNVLGRDPEAAGLAFWKGNLDSGALSRADTLAGISESAENRAVTAPLVASGIWDLSESAAQVARLYDTALGRLPDAGGLSYWRNAIDAGTGTLSDLANVFVTSAEFQSRYGALTNRAFVEAVYGNTLGRPGDTAGVDYWTGVLDSGTLRRAVVIGFSESAEHQARTAPNVSSNDPSNYGIKLA